jgi:hypothetical protein
MKKGGYIMGAIIALLVIVGLVLSRADRAGMPSPTASSTSMGTTTVDLGNGMTATLPPGVTITQSSTPVSGGVSTPNLNQAVTYSPDLSADVVATLKADIAGISLSLKSDPSQGNKWLQLAYYYKAAEDYKLAEQVWLYMTKLAPTDPVAFADLGNLYNSFLVDYPKAEKYYLQAIKLNPADINTYYNLYLMYRYQYKTNTTAAADIVAAGLKANPGNADLLQLQTELKK